MAEVSAISVNPEEALAFFRAKKFKLDPSFDWRDRKAIDHAWSFTVAKSAGFDILADIHAAVEKAIAEGTTLADFQKELKPLLQEKGWWGRKDVTDPATGEVVSAQLGSARRLRVIFQTNLRMAYMAGKWQRIMRVAEKRPWLRYNTVRDERVRKSHRSWHGVVLRYDDPWWNQHYPPNDFGCRCDVQQLSDADLQRFKFVASQPGGPQGLPRTSINRRTGEVTQVPDGIKPGFEHNVGKLGQEAHSGKLLMDRLAAMPADLAAKAGQASQAFALSGVSYEFMGWVQAVLAGTATSSLRVAGMLPPQALDAMVQKPFSAAIVTTADDVIRLNAGSRLPLADVLRLPQLLGRPQAVLHNAASDEIVYVFPRDGANRLVVWLKPQRVSNDVPYSITRIIDAAVITGERLGEMAGLKLVSGAL